LRRREPADHPANHKILFKKRAIHDKNDGNIVAKLKCPVAKSCRGEADDRESLYI
jgi:hypothetical protein